jgi:hypothetical protein
MMSQLSEDSDTSAKVIEEESEEEEEKNEINPILRKYLREMERERIKFKEILNE